MNSILNIILVCISLIMIILLCAMYPLSRMNNDVNSKSEAKTRKLRMLLKKWHKPLGISIIIVMFMHGKMIGQRPGVEAILILLLSVLLLCSYLLRKKFSDTWISIHRYLSQILVVLIAFHICISLT